MIHFYHLHALDWVDIVSALSGRSRQDRRAGAVDLRLAAVEREILRRRAGSREEFVERGQLGPFANAYWGHPAYKLPPEANLHGGGALPRGARMAAGLHPHARHARRQEPAPPELPGRGMATPIDPDQQASINAGTIAGLRELIASARDFVEQVYIPDLLAVASFYKDWAGHGGGVGNYLVYGEYPGRRRRAAGAVSPRGIIRGTGTSARSSRSIQAKITEYVTHSWYEYEGGDEKGLHPSRARPSPSTPGPKPPYERLGHRPRSTAG